MCAGREYGWEGGRVSGCMGGWLDGWVVGLVVGGITCEGWFSGCRINGRYRIQDTRLCVTILIGYFPDLAPGHQFKTMWSRTNIPLVLPWRRK